ncbi:L-seryl-tRNA(Sec) selenium transferase, partial [bacterium]|nr:L-seryl-tRNA(Sec) selenium transferase [bacterium]
QGGILVGKREIIDRVKKNPLTRALRGDKMQYAATEAVWKLYLEPEKLPQTHPVLRMVTEPAESVKRRTQNFRRRISAAIGDRAVMSIEPDGTEMGSGSLPGKGIPTYVLRMVPNGRTADCIGGILRKGRPPVFIRIVEDALLFDLRTVAKAEEKVLAECVIKAFDRAFK